MSNNPVYAVLVDKLNARKDMAYLLSSEIMSAMRRLTHNEREELALETRSHIVYVDDEVKAVKDAEETAVLRAVPVGYKLEELNGLNIGAGSRIVHPCLIQIDICRAVSPIYNPYSTLPNVVLSDAAELPFKPESLDYIVALHTVEHMPYPIRVTAHWLDLLKPGGGLGMIVPDWRYTWDARGDWATHGHKMNATPKLFSDLHSKHWHDCCDLEQLATYEYKMSFDVVLRKKGIFKPFTPANVVTTGMELHKSGMFLHSDD